MGLSPAMSAMDSAMARLWAPVSRKGSRSSNSCGKRLGRGWAFLVRRPFLMAMSPSCSTRNSSKISRRLAMSRSPADRGKWMFSRA